jgi:uncharacterized membrane protein
MSETKERGKIKTLHKNSKSISSVKESYKMSNEGAQAYRIVAVKFAGQDRAKQVVELVKKHQKDAAIKVKAWVVVEVDDKGKAHVRQTGHGGMGAATGGGMGMLLGLIGGPAGLLVWALGGALVGGLAGKYLGHQFDSDEIKALAASMEPNTSALLIIIEDKLLESLEEEMGAHDGQIVTVTVADQMTGELDSVVAIDLGEAGEADEADASGESDEAKSE